MSALDFIAELTGREKYLQNGRDFWGNEAA